MEKYFEILRKCPLFENVGDERLGVLLRCLGARVVDFKKNSTVVAEGSRAEWLGIMLSGAAQVINDDYFGNRSILGVIGVGDVFCEEFACADLKAVPVSVIADTDCKVMLIDCSHIIHTCTNACGFHQQLIYNLMRELALKNIDFHDKLAVSSARTTRMKLLTYLGQVAEKTGKRSFSLPFDRQELADYLEVERSGLSTEIGKLCREGVIENHKNHFKLL